MRHLKSGRKLKRTSSHRKALLRNLATALFEHKKITTTEAKAKELRPYAEKLITRAKNALLNEKSGTLPEGQTIDIHNRRIVGRDIQVKAVLQELFDTIAQGVEDRPGGYTRIIKKGYRRGDGGKTAIIELVDWAAPLDGAVGLKAKRKVKAKSEKIDASKVIPVPKAKSIVPEPITTLESAIEEVSETIPVIEETIPEIEITDDAESFSIVSGNEAEQSSIEIVDEKPATEEKKEE